MRIALEVLFPYSQFLEHGGQQALAYLRLLDECCPAAEVQPTMAALSDGPVTPELQTGLSPVPLGASDEFRSVQVYTGKNWPTGDDAFFLFYIPELEVKNSPLLNFRAHSDKWQYVHIWLRQAGLGRETKLSWRDPPWGIWPEILSAP